MKKPVRKAQQKSKRGTSKNLRKPDRKKISDQIRLNKYIANAGICSRREADTLIQTGLVEVNGKIITELGTKVTRDDKVKVGDRYIKGEKLVYLMLNKPKDYITTSKDPFNRKTVLNLVSKACKERVFPVGRLDRNTTGVLLFTNDGDLSNKLLHPRKKVEKIYHAFLDKNLKPDHLEKLIKGLSLEDGFARANEAAYVAGKKDQIGLNLHIGKNRIVRRMFEHLGYKVVKLDRVSFAGLTKKNVPRGKYRFLTEREVGFLKMLVGS